MPAYDTKLTLKSNGLQSSSTSGTAVDLGAVRPNEAQLMQFDLLWTALTTGPADIVIEESADNSTFRQVATFRQLTATPDGVMTGRDATGKRMSRFGLVTQRWLRYRSVIGAGSLNFGLFALGLDGTARNTAGATF